MEDPISRAAAVVERDLLHFLRGGCRAPVGARGFLEGEGERRTLKLVGRVLSLDGRECLEDEMSAPAPQPSPSHPSQRSLSSFSSSLGRELAERLLARGAARLIDTARERTPG
ncbi:MAG: hypothetical protein ACXVH0_04500 [Thermoanaerobaculia bacterium]